MRKVFIIFTIGLLLRIFLSYFVYIDPSQEYSACISLVCFTSAAWAALSLDGFLQGIGLNLNVFNFNFLSKALKSFLHNSFNYMYSGNSYLIPKDYTDKLSGVNPDKSKLTLQFSSNARNKSQVPGAGAALYGLYEKNTGISQSQNYRNGGDNSLSFRFKNRIKWYLWAKHTDKFDSFSDYKRYIGKKNK